MRISDWSSDVCSSDLACGEVVEMSPLGTDVSSLVILGAHGRLHLADRQADELLDDALASLTSAPEISARSFPVSDAAGMPRQVAHLIPVPRGPHDVFEIGGASSRERVCLFV